MRVPRRRTSRDHGSRPRVHLVVQPTVSHYREPLLRRLLASTRLDVDLVGRYRNSEGSAADRIQSASPELLEQVTPLRFLSWGELWWERGQVGAVLSGRHDAYVLAGRIYTLSAWAALLAGRLTGRTVLLWGHGWKRPEDGLKRRLRLAFYALCDGLLVYGDRAHDLGRSYGVAEEKIAVVYNSIYSEDQLAEGPAEERPEPGHPGEDPARGAEAARRPTLIYSSRLTARHRLDTLAEALEMMPARTRPRVLVVGDGVERPRLERRFAEAEVDAEFLGAVYDLPTLRRLYAQADAAVSIGGAGLNVTQALSLGVPVVAEDGNPDSSPEIEAVIDGETGRLYRSGDPESLREVLQELVEDPAGLRRMARRGLEVVRERYTAERHAEAMEEAILAFLDARGAPRRTRIA
ncbi:glycosyltransferase family 4 protein [Nesterenkonia sp. HG001]|uniref:glycosyltransferase family 4 protein n=1 Tax=Nesterenkonia sp. HG001 TaxID=2983207 RepID=UPI002AC3D5E8|nr:glycosyltransferase family 4 protein [Nesterenkonia sp. HG001]MDZ5078040.1 glycosyltransferase family 4 protein [Nesterenkonia sp. HG001]